MLLLAAGIFMVWQQRKFFFLWTPEQACRQVYSANPFVESTVIADYLSRNSLPDQQVAGDRVGAADLFLRQEKRRHGPYLLLPLVERQPYASKLQQEMCREVEAAKPEFVVFVHNSLVVARRFRSRRALSMTGRSTISKAITVRWD